MEDEMLRYVSNGLPNNVSQRYLLRLCKRNDGPLCLKDKGFLL